MTMLAREPGTYRTSSGVLVHSWAYPDGRIVIEREDGNIDGEELVVKLSDDPYWPDVERLPADLTLFCD
jgi:hypothetical protein